MKNKLKEFVRIANEYSGIEYGFNTKIIGWKGQLSAAIVTIEDQDDPDNEQDQVYLSYDGKTYIIENTEGKLLATTRYPRILFAILYV